MQTEALDELGARLDQAPLVPAAGTALGDRARVATADDDV